MADPHPTDIGLAVDQGFFKVTGWWQAIVDPLLSGSWSMPETLSVQGLVTFTPRVPIGSLLYLEDAGESKGLVLAPRYARIWGGRLSSINTTDSADVYLVSNDPRFNLMDSVGLSELIWDVTFTKVTYGGKPSYAVLPDGSPAPTVKVSQLQQITPFAFEAPADPSEVVCLTDPGLKRLPYKKRPGPQAPVG